MEQRLFDYFRDTRRNYTQMVSFVTAGSAVFFAALLTSSLPTHLRGIGLAAMAAMLVPVCLLHVRARRELEELKRDMAKYEGTAPFEKYVNHFLGVTKLSFCCYLMLSLIVAAFAVLTLAGYA